VTPRAPASDRPDGLSVPVRATPYRLAQKRHHGSQARCWAQQGSCTRGLQQELQQFPATTER
ncbi:MAG: hypothetical protein ACREX4_24730, partial [Gammaproteobacteria bacterium]